MEEEGRRGRSREGGRVEGNRWQGIGWCEEEEEEGSWRHLGKYRTEEVERVEIAAEEGGRRRLRVCLFRSCLFD